MTEVDDKDLDREEALEVTLNSCGNPDYDQSPFKGLPGVEHSRRRVGSLREAAACCRRYIDENDLGGGNWSGGEVIRIATNEVVARVSYNGRVWLPEEPKARTPVGRGVVSVYSTRTGIEALRIFEAYNTIRDDFVYDYISLYGSGSGLDAAEMLRCVDAYKQFKRGVRLTGGSEFSEVCRTMRAESQQEQESNATPTPRRPKM